jgi:hypothetical protein
LTKTGVAVEKLSARTDLVRDGGATEFFSSFLGGESGRPPPPHATPQRNGGDAFKSEHPPVPDRPRLFPPEKSAAR